jgi:hypothetical protein
MLDLSFTLEMTTNFSSLCFNVNISGKISTGEIYRNSTLKWIGVLRIKAYEKIFQIPK